MHSLKSQSVRATDRVPQPCRQRLKLKSCILIFFTYLIQESKRRICRERRLSVSKIWGDICGAERKQRNTRSWVQSFECMTQVLSADTTVEVLVTHLDLSARENLHQDTAHSYQLVPTSRRMWYLLLHGWSEYSQVIQKGCLCCHTLTPRKEETRKKGNVKENYHTTAYQGFFGQESEKRLADLAQVLEDYLYNWKRFVREQIFIWPTGKENEKTTIFKVQQMIVVSGETGCLRWRSLYIYSGTGWEASKRLH